MNVNVSSLIVPRTARNKRIYAQSTGGSSSVTSVQSTASASIPKIIIPFASALPTITDYQSVYASIHGNHPNVSLMIYTATGRLKSQREAQFTTVAVTGSPDDLINTIFFDLGNIETGFIILQ